MYIAIAYRWGELNGHHYFVYCGPDETKALALAQTECQDRGGKYGVRVHQFNEDGTEYKTIAYFPSMTEKSDAKAPHHNTRKDMLQDLGLALEGVVKSGTFDQKYREAGEGNDAYRVRSLKVPIPRWAKVAYARAKHRETFMRKVYKVDE